MSQRERLAALLDDFSHKVDAFDVGNIAPCGPSQFRERLHPALIEASTCLDDLASCIKATGGPSLKTLVVEAQSALTTIQERMQRLETQLRLYGYQSEAVQQQQQEEEEENDLEDTDMFHSAQSSPGSSAMEHEEGVEVTDRMGPEGVEPTEGTPLAEDDLSLQTLGLSKAALRALGVGGQPTPSPPPPTPLTAAAGTHPGFGRSDALPPGSTLRPAPGDFHFHPTPAAQSSAGPAPQAQPAHALPQGRSPALGRDATPDLTIQLSTTAMAAIMGTAVRPGAPTAATAAPSYASPGARSEGGRMEVDLDQTMSASPGALDLTPPRPEGPPRTPGDIPPLSPRIDQILSQIPASALKAPNSALRSHIKPAFKSTLYAPESATALPFPSSAFKPAVAAPSSTPFLSAAGGGSAPYPFQGAVQSTPTPGHRIFTFGVDPAQTYVAPPSVRPAFVSSTSTPQTSNRFTPFGTGAAGGALTAAAPGEKVLRSVGPTEYDTVPRFLANQIPLEELNGMISKLNSLLRARGTDGLSLEDAEMLGLGSKAKVLLTILMRLDRISPSVSAASKNYYRVVAP